MDILAVAEYAGWVGFFILLILFLVFGGGVGIVLLLGPLCDKLERRAIQKKWEREYGHKRGEG
jgi:hypothetical protein